MRAPSTACALALWVSACGGEGGDLDPMPDAASPDAGPGPDGGPALPTPERPRLTPCPEGWGESTDPDGIPFCRPWPDEGPTSGACPDGWIRSSTGAGARCAPPPGWPIQWPCPSGWRTRDELGITTCEPFPAEGRQACASHEAHFPGSAGCEPVGPPCPAGDFAAELPSGPMILYVQEGEGGDGSAPDRPRGSLDQATLDRLPDGAVVALGRGTYTAGWVLRRSVSLVGACAAGTRLVLPDPGRLGEDGVLRVQPPPDRPSPSVRLRGLTIGPSPQKGLRAVESPEIRIEGVVIEGTDSGLLVRGPAALSVEALVIRGTSPRLGLGRGVELQQGSSLEGRRVVLEDTQDAAIVLFGEGTRLMLEDAHVRGVSLATPTSNGALGLNVREGTRAEVRRLVLEEATSIGVFVTGGGELTLEDAVVREILSPGGRQSVGGRGISVQAGGTLVLRRALVERNEGAGMFVAASERSGGPAPVQAELTDVVIRNHRRRPGELVPVSGIEASQGATVEGRRIVVERFVDRGLLASDGARLRLEDALVRGRDEPDSPLGGRGLWLRNAEAEVRRALFSLNREAAVLAQGPSTELLLEDVRVEDTGSRLPDLSQGTGLAVVEGAQVTARRIAIAGNRLAGVSVQDRSSFLRLEDARVEDTRPTELDDAYGFGVVALAAARLELRRAELLRNRTAGVFASGAAEVLLDGVRVEATREAADTGSLGRGVEVQGGSEVRATRLHLRRNRSAGAAVLDPGTRFEAEDVVIEETRSRAADGGFGTGLLVGLGGQARLGRSRIERFRDSGIVVIDDSGIEATDVFVRDARGRAQDGDFGQGIAVESGASVRFERLHVARCFDHGLRVLSGATATVTDAIIRDTQPAPCTELTPACASAGSGLGTASGGRLSVERAIVSGSFACGVYVLAGGRFLASELLLENNDVGACFEDPLVDPSNLRAIYRGNRDAIELVNVPPSPAPLPPPDRSARPGNE